MSKKSGLVAQLTLERGKLSRIPTRLKNISKPVQIIASQQSKMN